MLYLNSYRVPPGTAIGLSGEAYKTFREKLAPIISVVRVPYFAIWFAANFFVFVCLIKRTRCLHLKRVLEMTFLGLQAGKSYNIDNNLNIYYFLY